MRQEAFAGSEKILKGQLHCHTNRSDGSNTPEEVIRFYYQNGFEFIALTDHKIYNLKDFVPELPITVLPGMEFDNMLERASTKRFRCFHTVCIGPVKEEGNGFEQDERWKTGTAKNQEEYQYYLDCCGMQNSASELERLHYARTLETVKNGVWEYLKFLITPLA